MTYHIYELQNRPDGVTNVVDTVNRSSLATGSSYYYGRCSTASANESFISSAIWMTDDYGNRILPVHDDGILIDGAYEESSEE